MKALQNQEGLMKTLVAVSAAINRLGLEQKKAVNIKFSVHAINGEMFDMTISWVKLDHRTAYLEGFNGANRSVVKASKKFNRGYTRGYREGYFKAIEAIRVIANVQGLDLIIPDPKKRTGPEDRVRMGRLIKVPLPLEVARRRPVQPRTHEQYEELIAIVAPQPPDHGFQAYDLRGSPVYRDGSERLRNLVSTQTQPINTYDYEQQQLQLRQREDELRAMDHIRAINPFPEF